jgi:hypothetical protein
MKSLLVLLASMIFAAPAIASSKTLTVLGDKKVKTQWDGAMPKAMSDQGIETNVTGIIVSDGKLIPTFGFDVATKKKLVRVQVEDVTGKEAILMVEDMAPVVERAHWKGNSSSRDITQSGVPWLYSSGDTLTVYRFTVYLEGQAQPVVIYQPSVFRDSSKARLRDVAAAMKKG